MRATIVDDVHMGTRMMMVMMMMHPSRVHAVPRRAPLLMIYPLHGTRHPFGRLDGSPDDSPAALAGSLMSDAYHTMRQGLPCSWNTLGLGSNCPTELLYARCTSASANQRITTPVGFDGSLEG